MLKPHAPLTLALRYRRSPEGWLQSSLAVPDGGGAPSRRDVQIVSVQMSRSPLVLERPAHHPGADSHAGQRGLVARASGVPRGTWASPLVQALGPEGAAPALGAQAHNVSERGMSRRVLYQA